jgi:hypothetical protein
MTTISPPRHIVWSTDRLDLADPLRRKWYVRWVIDHGKAEDGAGLGVDAVVGLLDEPNLPPHLHSLWSRFPEHRHAVRGDVQIDPGLWTTRAR